EQVLSDLRDRLHQRRFAEVKPRQELAVVRRLVRGVKTIGLVVVHEQILNDRDRVEQRHRVVDEHGYLPERVKLQKVGGTQRLGIERQHLELVLEPELLQQIGRAHV